MTQRRRRTPQLNDASGQTMAEYSTLVAVIALVVVVVLPWVASALTGFFAAAGRALGV